jgi:hypothetical protein
VFRLREAGEIKLWKTCCGALRPSLGDGEIGEHKIQRRIPPSLGHKPRPGTLKTIPGVRMLVPSQTATTVTSPKTVLLTIGLNIPRRSGDAASIKQTWEASEAPKRHIKKWQIKECPWIPDRQKNRPKPIGDQSWKAALLPRSAGETSDPASGK